MGFFDNFGQGMGHFAQSALKSYTGLSEIRDKRKDREERIAREKARDAEAKRQFEELQKIRMDQLLMQKTAAETAQRKALLGEENDSAYRRDIVGLMGRPEGDHMGGGVEVPYTATAAERFETVLPYMKPENAGTALMRQMELEKRGKDAWGLGVGKDGQPIHTRKKEGLPAYEKSDTKIINKMIASVQNGTATPKTKAFLEAAGYGGYFQEKPDKEKNDTEITLVAKAAKGDPNAKRTLAALLDHKKQVAAAGRDPSRLDKSNRMFAITLRNQLNSYPEIREANSVTPKIESMEAAYNESLTTKNFVAVDQALITLYNKLTDPTSVVRESEYDRTSKNIPLVNALKGKAMKILEGGAGLTPEERMALLKMARLMKKGYDDIKRRRINEYKGYALNAGLDPAKTFAEEIGTLPEAGEGAGKFVIERRTTKSGKKLVKYSDGTIGEE